jgi:hypothetical protein
MRDPRPMYFVWEPSDLPIYPYKVYVRSEAHMFCKGCRAPESPCILYGGPCILYGELKQELKVVVGTVDSLAQPYTAHTYKYCITPRPAPGYITYITGCPGST